MEKELREQAEGATGRQHWQNMPGAEGKDTAKKTKCKSDGPVQIKNKK